MKGLGIGLIVLGGMILYWAWNGQDLSALPNSNLPPNGGPPTTFTPLPGQAGQQGATKAGPLPGSPLYNQLFGTTSTQASTQGQSGLIV